MDMAPGLNALRRVAGWGLDLLAPPGCMACDAPVVENFRLCGACFAGCHFIAAPFCRCCGAPFAFAGQAGMGGLCPGCVAHRPAFGQARAALAYDARSRGLILGFKHGNRTELAQLFAPLMARAGAGLLSEAAVLVPVPLHISRLRQRGYNQAGLLAQALSKISGVPALPDALARTRRTAPMGGHSAEERRAAMAGAVAVRERRSGAIAGRRVVVVDDVLTSGATANECARVLLAAGAAAVDVLAVARVPDPELARS